MARKKANYSKTPEETQSKAYLVNNQDVRGVGEPYAIQGNFREASLPVDPLRIFGSVTTLPLAALPVATTTSKGIVELATSGENASSVVVQGNDARINVVTTKGDIYGCSAANTPARVAVGANLKVLKADSTASTGLAWKSVGGLGGLWMFGDGQDGALTLSGDTSLTNDENVKSYSNVTLAGYTLSAVTNDLWTVLFISGTLDGGGGSIVARTDENPTAGSLNGGGTGGDGGEGGRGGGTLYVFAAIATNVTINCSGVGQAPGTNGTDSTGANSAGAATSTTNAVCLHGLAVTLAAQAQGGQVAAGGVGMSVSAANQVNTRRQIRDFHRSIFPGQLYVAGIGVAGRQRACQAGSGAGGGSGGGLTAAFANDFRGGSGGGGGMGMWFGAGGAGGTGALQTTDNVDSAGGGAGGGGGGGGYLVFVSNDATSVTCSAAGAGGGAGGAGSSDVGWRGPGGGGGGGGSGGIVIAISPSGVTINVAGGAAGAGGSGVSEADGASGVAGEAGNSWNLTN